MEDLLQYAIPIIVVLLWALNHLMGNRGRQPERKPQGQGARAPAPAPAPPRRLADVAPGERQPPADRQMRMAAAGRGGAPDEIDRFLQEVAARRRAARAPQAPEVEVVRAGPAARPRPPAPARRPAPRPTRAPQPAPVDEVEVVAEPPTPTMREPVGRPLGAELATHVQTYMAATSAEEVHAHLDHAVGTMQAVEKAAEAAGATPPSPTAASIVEMLRTPDNLRNAILLSEILGRPRALR